LYHASSQPPSILGQINNINRLQRNFNEHVEMLFPRGAKHLEMGWWQTILQLVPVLLPHASIRHGSAFKRFADAFLNYYGHAANPIAGDLQLNKGVRKGGAVALAPLIQVSSVLTSLNLTRAEPAIKPSDMANLGEALQRNTSLMTLVVHSNEIPMKELKGLQLDDRGSCCLHLNLAECGITPNDGVIVGALIGINSTMTALDLRDNLLGPEAAGRLAMGIVQLEPALQSIVWLDISSNKLGFKGGNVVSTCLSKAHGLTHLDIRFVNPPPHVYPPPPVYPLRMSTPSACLPISSTKPLNVGPRSFSHPLPRIVVLSVQRLQQQRTRPPGRQGHRRRHCRELLNR
jgi:hypothetical protein